MNAIAIPPFVLILLFAGVLATQDKPVDVRATAKLAEQYVKLGKPQEGAELFEKIAPLDTNLAAWHWKEAARAWLAVKQKDRAKAAAQAAVAPSKWTCVIPGIPERGQLARIPAAGTAALPGSRKSIAATRTLIPVS